MLIIRFILSYQNYHVHGPYVRCDTYLDKWIDVVQLSALSRLPLPFLMSLSLCEADTPEHPSTVHTTWAMLM